MEEFGFPRFTCKIHGVFFSCVVVASVITASTRRSRPARVWSLSVRRGSCLRLLKIGGRDEPKFCPSTSRLGSITSRASRGCWHASRRHPRPTRLGPDPSMVRRVRHHAAVLPHRVAGTRRLLCPKELIHRKGTRMRLQNMGGLVAALMLLVASLVSAYHSVERPTNMESGSLTVDLPVQDLGRLRQGVRSPCYFYLKNASS